MASDVCSEKRPPRDRNQYLFVEMASSIGKRRSEEIKKKQEKNRKTRRGSQNHSKRLWKRRTAKYFGGFYDVLAILKGGPLDVEKTQCTGGGINGGLFPRASSSPPARGARREGQFD
jgi:hypothetical protein